MPAKLRVQDSEFLGQTTLVHTLPQSRGNWMIFTKRVPETHFSTCQIVNTSCEN